MVSVGKDGRYEIDAKDYVAFRLKYHRTRMKSGGQRFGQMFCNEMLPKVEEDEAIRWNDVLYEPSMTKAESIIKRRVRFI